MACEQPNSAATTRLVLPAAQANTILDRNAKLCGLEGRRAQRANVARSSSSRIRTAFGRPVRAMRTSIVACPNTPRFTEIPDPPTFHMNLRITTLVGAVGDDGGGVGADGVVGEVGEGGADGFGGSQSVAVVGVGGGGGAAGVGGELFGLVVGEGLGVADGWSYGYPVASGVVAVLGGWSGVGGFEGDGGGGQAAEPPWVQEVDMGPGVGSVW